MTAVKDNPILSRARDPASRQALFVPGTGNDLYQQVILYGISHNVYLRRGSGHLGQPAVGCAAAG